MALHLCPLCFPFEGFVFLLLPCESFALPSSWSDVFSHLASLGFWGAPRLSPPAACPANLWLMGHPRAGAILQIFQLLPFPTFFIDSILTSSLVGMDFVQLRRQTEKLHSKVPHCQLLLCHRGAFSFWPHGF